MSPALAGELPGPWLIIKLLPPWKKGEWMLRAPHSLSEHPIMSPWSTLYSLCSRQLFQTLPPTPPLPSPWCHSEHTASLPALRSKENSARTSFNLLRPLNPNPNLQQPLSTYTHLFPSKARPYSWALNPFPPPPSSTSKPVSTFHCLQPLYSLCASH